MKDTTPECPNCRRPCRISGGTIGITPAIHHWACPSCDYEVETTEGEVLPDRELQQADAHSIVIPLYSTPSN